MVLAAGFLAAVVLTAVVLATGFFAAVDLTAVVLATGFFAAVVFATGFLATGFFAAVVFATGFLATGFLAVAAVFCDPCGDFFNQGQRLCGDFLGGVTNFVCDGCSGAGSSLAGACEKIFD